MTQLSETTTEITVTVRYFAAARAAAGSESQTLTVPAGTTVAELIDGRAAQDRQLAAVLARCSFLRDGVAVRDRDIALTAGETLDVLPPFAGG